MYTHKFHNSSFSYRSLVGKIKINKKLNAHLKIIQKIKFTIIVKLQKTHSFTIKILFS